MKLRNFCLSIVCLALDIRRRCSRIKAVKELCICNLRHHKIHLISEMFVSRENAQLEIAKIRCYSKIINLAVLHLLWPVQNTTRSQLQSSTDFSQLWKGRCQIHRIYLQKFTKKPCRSFTAQESELIVRMSEHIRISFFTGNSLHHLMSFSMYLL